MKELLSDGIENYMSLRSSQDFSRKTLNNERGVLRRFLTVTGNIWMNNIGERQVIRYFEEASKTRSARSLQLDHTYLGQFFAWGRQTRRMATDNDPMAGRRRPKARKKERDRIPVVDFSRLLDAAGERDARDRCVTAVLLYTLCRDNEAVGIRIQDVRLNEGYLRLRISKTYTEDDMPICAELDTELRRWLTHYASTIDRPLHPTDYLFPARKSVGMTRTNAGKVRSHIFTYEPSRTLGQIGRFMSSILEAIGFAIEDHEGKRKFEGAHTIRRSGARALFDRLAAEGYDRALRIVQSMLHHSSVQTTELYIGVTADQRGRDEIIRGRRMFPIESENVLQISV